MTGILQCSVIAARQIRESLLCATWAYGLIPLATLAHVVPTALSSPRTGSRCNSQAIAVLTSPSLLHRLANMQADDVGRLCVRGTICNGSAKWSMLQATEPMPVWFVFSGERCFRRRPYQLLHEHLNTCM